MHQRVMFSVFYIMRPWRYSGLKCFMILFHIRTGFRWFWTLFKTKSIMQNEPTRQWYNALDWYCHSKMAIQEEPVGGNHPSAFWREMSWAESRWDEEKWPFIFDGNEREGELTVIQTAFCADLQLRISHRGSECGELGGQWPLPTRTPERRLSKKETLKWCLTASEHQVFSACKHVSFFL